MILSITVYNNARFDPVDTGYVLRNPPLISSTNNCLCECFNNITCHIATYVSINQTCVLFSAQLSQGNLKVVPSVLNATVYYLRNRNTAGK